MADQLLLTLQITLVGMGLVFGAIILLWGLMALTVRLAQDPAQVPAASSEELSTPDDAAAPAPSLRARAAAAAITVMLQQAGQARPLPATATITPWQAVMRSNQINQKGPRR